MGRLQITSFWTRLGSLVSSVTCMLRDLYALSHTLSFGGSSQESAVY